MINIETHYLIVGIGIGFVLGAWIVIMIKRRNLNQERKPIKTLINKKELEKE